MVHISGNDQSNRQPSYGGIGYGLGPTRPGSGQQPSAVGSSIHGSSGSQASTSGFSASRLK